MTQNRSFPLTKNHLNTTECSAVYSTEKFRYLKKVSYCRDLRLITFFFLKLLARCRACLRNCDLFLPPSTAPLDALPERGASNHM